MDALCQIAAITVNCRIGSLEIDDDEALRRDLVNCRIGSLENLPHGERRQVEVNCRIGSLEIEGSRQDT